MSGGNAGLEEALEAAEEMLAEGAAADAAQTFAAVLAEDEGNVAALAGLARAHLALGEIERAREILALAPKGKENDPAIAAARAQIELAEASAGAGEAGALRAAVERDPDDHQARYDLAMALVGKGDQEGGDRRRCSSSSGATGSGTRARPRRSSSSSSTAWGRRARRRRRGGGGSPR